MVNDQETKAGHGPATIVGGARRRTRSKGDGGMAAAVESEVVAKEECTQENVENSEEVAESQEVQTADPEAVAPYKENSPDAVKAFHEKPMPTKNVQITKNPQISHNKMQIQQPRK